MLHSFTSNIL